MTSGLLFFDRLNSGSHQMSNTTEGLCYKEVAQEGPPLFQNGKIVLQAYHIGWIFSGSFALIALITSLWLISQHLRWYTNRREQRYIVRLLFMVPLYALISFASFLFWNHSTPIILVRDAYEAIVLTAFFYLLLMYISHDVEEQRRVFLRKGLSVEADERATRKGENVSTWMFPLSFVKWKPKDGLYFLQLMKWGVLQYCVIRPTTTLAAIILDYRGLYCEDSWSVGWGHLYITVIMSVSVTIAMYCLIQLYIPISKDLARHKPLLKLFSVKAVVFLTFWQATFLSILSLFGVVKANKYMTADDVNIGIGAVLETFEMMLFAFLHIRAFTYTPYQDVDPKTGMPPDRTPQWRSLGHAMDFRETFREIWIGCIYMFDKMRGKDPTPDFGVLRESHYESAFGHRRPLPGEEQWSNPECDKLPTSKSPTLPHVTIAVNREVEIEVEGQKQWFGLDKFGRNRRYSRQSRQQKSEGLGEQIDYELERLGYPRLSLGSQKETETRHNFRNNSPRQRSWWRSIYDRISQSGHDIREIEEEPLNEREYSFRQRYHIEPLTQYDHELDDPPPRSILHPYYVQTSKNIVSQNHDRFNTFHEAANIVSPRDDEHDRDPRQTTPESPVFSIKQASRSFPRKSTAVIVGNNVVISHDDVNRSHGLHRSPQGTAQGDEVYISPNGSYPLNTSMKHPSHTEAYSWSPSPPPVPPKVSLGNAAYPNQDDQVVYVNQRC